MAIGKDEDLGDTLPKVQVGADKNDLASKVPQDVKSTLDSSWNIALGRNRFTDKDEYNKAKRKPEDLNKSAAERAREKAAEKRDTPTIAAADKGKKIPESLMQVDPAMLSQVLPNLYKQFMQIRNLLMAFNSMNKGSSKSANADQNSNKSLQDVFLGALCILSNKFGYLQVLSIIFKTLSNDQYKLLTLNYQEIVFNAIVELIKKAEQYGETNIPISTVPSVVYGTKLPSPIYVSYDAVPNYYIQQYYTQENDPYPGFIEWISEDGEVTIYIKRTSTDYPFESAEQEVHTLAEINLADELAPYFNPRDTLTLTVTILNELLTKYNQIIKDKKLDKNMGKNSKNNLLALLSMLAGLAGQLSSKAQSSHLPVSVLNIASVTKTLDKHKENIGKIKKMKQLSETAFMPQMSIPNLGALTSLLSQLNSLAQLNPANAEQKVRQAIGQIKSLIR